jgi:tetratricopeptide (TPR) repeat protein
MIIRPIITLLVWGCSLLLSAQINAERMMIIGRNALSYDDYALSIQYFSQVISAKPHLYEPYFFRGLAKFYLEDYTGAEVDCSKSILLNPYYVNSYEVRGLSRINLKDYVGAASDYEEAINLDDSKRSIWHNLVLCYLEVDSLEKADVPSRSAWQDRYIIKLNSGYIVALPYMSGERKDIIQSILNKVA